MAGWADGNGGGGEGGGWAQTACKAAGRAESMGGHTDGVTTFSGKVGRLASHLAQWDGPVHVDASKIFGRGKFYVAVTRCRDLRQLKISGINGYGDLRRVVKSNWRAIDFHVKHGQRMPESSKRYAAKQKQTFLNLTTG